MSKRDRVLRLPGAAPNVLTTAAIAQPPAEPNAPIQEKIMEASQEKTPEASAEAPAEQIGLTAKEMAAAEEVNAARIKAQISREQAAAEADQQEPVSIIGLAAQGREVLLDQMRQHMERTKPKEYIPPPRTARQMSALEEELEAGRRSQARAQAQQDARPAPTTDLNKEGFTTPVYRPNDLVPDPTIPATRGYLGGTRKFGADAP